MQVLRALIITLCSFPAFAIEETIEKLATGTPESSGWVVMNGEGSDWYKTSGAITGFLADGSIDFSVEQFYQLDFSSVPWYWDKKPLAKVHMNDKGTGEYRCKDNHIVTHLYYHDGFDDSIEEFGCQKLLRGRTREVTMMPVRLGTTSWCPANTFLTGMLYKDFGDDYVQAMICSEVLL